MHIQEVDDVPVPFHAVLHTSVFISRQPSRQPHVDTSQVCMAANSPDLGSGIQEPSSQCRTQAVGMKSQFIASPLVLLPLEVIYPIAFVLVLILLSPTILSWFVPLPDQANLSSFCPVNQLIILNNLLTYII